jgi:selenide, water dikinase
VSVAPESVRLTTLSHGAGCACKIGAAEIAPLIAALPRPEDPALLVGTETADDAAVYRLTDELAIVQSADFFTPIVDDPYDFGRVAAANALSDVYAMGAEPVLALNLVAFSLPDLGPEVLSEILRGGADVVRAAGASLAGGHSIDDPEPKYGLAVTGIVHPERMLTNATGRAGDLLFLTKPLGGGLVTTAAKRGLADPALIARVIETMVELNADAARAAVEARAHAMTDVTGFGLLGHLHELCEASGVAAEIEAGTVPAIEGALDLASEERCIAGGSRRNGAYAEAFTAWDDDVAPERRVLLYDAMTSGGLLIAIPPEKARDSPGVPIGRLNKGEPGSVRVG